jgi:lipopolysaccharide transport system permease protein
MPLMIRALWGYRQFIVSSVQREIQTRYRASLLGAFWTVAQPLALVVIYTVIFGQLLGARLPGHDAVPYAFSIYLCAGVITWTLFTEMLTQLSTVFLDNSTLIKKTAFPRICLPAIVTGTALVNFCIILTLYLGFLWWVDHLPGMVFLAIIPLVVLQILFALGLGILLGTANVFFRDVAQFVGVLLQFWFWLTPIVYPADIVPERFQGLLALNPFKSLIMAYQGIFLYQQWPDFSSLLPLALMTAFLLAVGLWFFLRRAGEMVDEL